MNFRLSEMAGVSDNIRSGLEAANDSIRFEIHKTEAETIDGKIVDWWHASIISKNYIEKTGVHLGWEIGTTESIINDMQLQNIDNKDPNQVLFAASSYAYKMIRDYVIDNNCQTTLGEFPEPFDENDEQYDHYKQYKGDHTYLFKISHRRDNETAQ